MNLIDEMISVPAWKTFGMVVGQRPATLGSDNCVDVLLQEHPEQSAGTCKWYHLEPNEYELIG